MPAKAAPKTNVYRNAAKQFLARATEAFSAPLAKAASFKDAKAFKAELLKHLEGHRGFHKAASDFHAAHGHATNAMAPKGSAKSKAALRPTGRTQAARFEGRRPKG